MYQTEPVAALGFTSEDSKVAPVLLPVLLPDEPEIVTGEEKLSFAGLCGVSVQFAVSVTLPFAAAVRFRNQTSPDVPFEHFCELPVIEVGWLVDEVPYFAVPVFSPLVTVHPANV